MFVVEREDFALFLVRAFLLGAFLGVLYLGGGFFRILLAKKGSMRVKVLGLFLPDLCFCLLAAFLNVLLIFAANRGQVRPVALFFEAGGFALILRLFGKWVYRLEKTLMHFLKHRVVLPIVMPLKRTFKRTVGMIKRRIQMAKIARFNQQLDRRLLQKIESELTIGEDLLFSDRITANVRQVEPEKTD